MVHEPTDDDPLADESARDLLAAIAAAPAVSLEQARYEQLEPGALFGEGLRIEAKIGSGGMGVVYRAFDFELDRPVALKLQRRTVDCNPVDRLRDEARAMARVSHPNVVTVHAVGVIDDVVYIAMELVKGGTLRTWLGTAGSRPVRDIAEMFLGAGEGLAAAHRAGLVHGDFKPDNVLVDDEGRPKVADFGLAQRALANAADTMDGVTEGSGPAAESTGPAAHRLGAGTPPYMAPEQIVGLPLDAASDQFSFCVCLSEALCGTRPFPVHPIARLEAIQTGTFVQPTRRIPNALMRVIRRGLAHNPSERFATMDALLQAVRRALTGPGWRAAVAGGAVVVAAVGAWFGLHTTAPSCTPADQQLAATWGDARRAEIGAAVSAGPYGQPGWHALERAIDGHAHAWGAAWTSACAVDPVGPVVACLLRAEGRLDTILRTLERSADAQGRGLDAIVALPQPETCESTAPGDPVPMFERELDDLAARREIESSESLIEESRALLKQARESGDAATVAAVSLEHARVVFARRGAAAAVDPYQQALADAIESGDPSAVHVALVGVASNLVDSNRLEQAEGYLPVLKAGLDHRRAELASSTASPALLARYGGASAAYAFALSSIGRHEDAIAEGVAAVEYWRRAVGDQGMGFLRVRMGLTTILLNAQRYDEAIEVAQSNLPALRNTLGAQHSAVAKTCGQLAAVCSRSGDLACARTSLDEAWAIITQTDPPLTAISDALTGLPVAAQELGDQALAMKLLSYTADRFEQEYGDDDYRTIEAWTAKAFFFADLGRYEEAIPFARRAFEAIVDAKRPADVRFPPYATLVAGLERQTGNPNKALPLHEAAIEHFEANAQGLGVLNLRIEYGHSLLAAGRPRDAAAQAKIALDLLADAGSRPAPRAEAEFLLARALGPNSDRAQTLARSAAAAYGTLGPRYADETAAVQAWQMETSKLGLQPPSATDKPTVP